MAETTGISWCDATFNPWRGCTKVSAGCRFCYADTLSGRNPATLGVWGPRGSRVVASESYWRLPLRWNRDAVARGERRRVFCASLADVFEGQGTMPAEAWGPVCAARERLFALIAATPHLDWLLLTKRPENVWRMLPTSAFFDHERQGDRLMLPNIWLGTSVENQEAADERIPELLKVPAAVRFVSCEPLLGPVDLRRVQTDTCEIDALTGDHGVTRPLAGRSPARVDWVIVGGESGPRARPMHPDWARSLRDQCEAAGTAFHFKQWGEYRPFDEKRDPAVHAGNLEASNWDPETDTARVGKRAAGRLLDGRTWDDSPQAGRLVGA